MHCNLCDLWFDHGCNHELCPLNRSSGEKAKADRAYVSTTAADLLSQKAVAARGVGANVPPGLGSARLCSPFHTSEVARGH